MKIHYLLCPDGTKLFSFHRHDYRSHTDKENKYSAIDGGKDCVRIIGEGKIGFSTVAKAIEAIRNQFTWTSIMDKDGNYLEKPVEIKLKDMETSHIEKILEKLQIKLFKEIFIQELKFRKNDNRNDHSK